MFSFKKKTHVAAYNAPVEDQDTEKSLSSLSEIEHLQKNKFKKVKTVLVVLSSAGMGFDIDSVRQKIIMTYPEAAIFFQSTSGKSFGVDAPRSVDLVIDLTGPGQRQPWFYSHKLRRMAKHIVGRNAGLFRKKIYDKIVDEKKQDALPKERVMRERVIQREVFALAGIPVVPIGDPTADRERVIALSLPPLSRQ